MNDQKKQFVLYKKWAPKLQIQDERLELVKSISIDNDVQT